MQQIPVALLDDRLMVDIFAEPTLRAADTRDQLGPGALEIPFGMSGFGMFGRHLTLNVDRNLHAIFVLVVNRLWQPLTIATDLSKNQDAYYGHWEAGPVYLTYDQRHKHNITVGTDNQIPAASKADNKVGVGGLILLLDFGKAFAWPSETIGGCLAFSSSDPNLEDTILVACQKTTPPLSAPIIKKPTIIGSVAVTNDPAGYTTTRDFYDKHCDADPHASGMAELKKGTGDDPGHAYRVRAGAALITGLPNLMNVVVTVEYGAP
jgi:hypothetical protein